MSQTDVLLSYTRQDNKTQLVAEKDTPGASIRTSMGDEKRAAGTRQRTEYGKKGLREEKRDANFRRATGGGQALRCVPAIDWLARPSIPSHQPSIRLVPCRPVCVLLGRSRKPWVAGQRPEFSAQVARPYPCLALPSHSGFPVRTRRIQAPLLASHCGGGQGRLDANQVVWLAFRLRQAWWKLPGIQTMVERILGIEQARTHDDSKQRRHSQDSIHRDASAPRTHVPRCSCCRLFRYECLEHQPGRQPCGGWGLVQLAGGYHGWRRLVDWLSVDAP
ncbi:hypothetical protein M441DRAFT_50922 [Trichoderma asperellum CBS 433.97]|uniref:Uncharacterized protein n=1 Tax=Trichoderma asperellum (strain ATCC 204424 / CBS 433.97 / NBRC 101777) TaxID=1042311 RepID=A0A2T3YWG6_TRIA4|nr:hypothetical protein M441DRAFT_50922 [Trichoderma asperellum CBS 433.97]PTB36905.1 hypothetical protein M441DRAFT_50922 [Trichoderma asperellum CBS 433.97]